MLEEIALFPLPGAVSLPYSVKPLRIFEPRYRLMIKDALLYKRRVGLAHTQKELSTKSENDHFLPYDVFSAGFVELLETLPDGQMIIQIKMDKRYKLQSYSQEIPYKIVLAQELLDLPNIDNENVIKNVRNNLDLTLLDIIEDSNSELKKYILSNDWKSLSHHEYSYAIYSLVLLEPNTLQKILEEPSLVMRIIFLQELLNKKLIQ